MRTYKNDYGIFFGRLTLERVLEQTNKIRSGFFNFTVLGKENTIIISDIVDELIEVCDDLKIDEVDVTTSCFYYDRFVTPIYFDSELKYYRIELRFKVISREK